jgi:hypothetical protein
LHLAAEALHVYAPRRAQHAIHQALAALEEEVL